MPGFLSNAGATVICAHGGQAQPTMTSQRVKVSGQPIVTLSAPYVVAGCPFVTPGGNGPCVSAQWVIGATRILSEGQFVLLQSSLSVCVPTGTPLIVLVTQPRVIGT